MPRVVRRADAVWEGNLARGGGGLSAGSSGAFAALPFSLPARIGDVEGKTSPEELLAAAHAGCYAMGLAGELTGRGTPPERLEVTASVVIDEVEGKGHQIVSSAIEATAVVAGIGEDDFRDAAHVADEECPLATLIRGTGTVTLEARLERPARGI